MQISWFDVEEMLEAGTHMNFDFARNSFWNIDLDLTFQIT